MNSQRMSPTVRRIGLTLAIVILILYDLTIVVNSAQRKSYGFPAYYTAAYILTHDPSDMGRIYDDDWFASQIKVAGIPGVHDIFNIQPPTMSLIMLPLVVFPPVEARIIWIVLSVIFLAAGIFLLANALRIPTSWTWLVVPVCFFYRPVVDTLRFGQVYLALFMLLCVIVWSILAGKKTQLTGILIPGISLGLAAMLKTAEIWLWPIFFLTRRARIVVWSSISATVIGLITLPWIGIAAWKAYISHLPEFTSDPRRFVTAYQTITSLVGHLTVYDAVWNPHPAISIPWIALPLTITVLLGSLLFTVWIGRRVGPKPDSQSLALAAFIALVVANAPVGEGYHYVMILPSIFIALSFATGNPSSWVDWLILAVVIFLTGAPLPYMSKRLVDGWWAVLAYPRVYGAYLLWLWLCIKNYRTVKEV